MGEGVYGLYYRLRVGSGRFEGFGFVWGIRMGMGMNSLATIDTRLCIYRFFYFYF